MAKEPICPNFSQTQKYVSSGLVGLDVGRHGGSEHHLRLRELQRRLCDSGQLFQRAQLLS